MPGIRPGLTLEGGVLLLVLGLSLFIFLHQLRELRLRETLLARLSGPVYRGLLSVGVLISLWLIATGKSHAAFVQLWVPPYSLRSLTHLFMIPACILVAAGNLPLSHTRDMLHHPMLIGVAVCGIAHLLSNGDLASLLMFGSIALWAVCKVITLERVAQNKPLSAPPSLAWDAAAVFLGTVAYTFFLVFHGPLFGYALVVLT